MIDEISSLDKRFKTISLDDIEIINEYVKKYPKENCDFNICTLFTWGLYFKLEYTIFNDRLILFNPFYGYLLAPLGEDFTAQELFQINNCCEKIHKKVEIMVVSEDYVNSTPSLGEYFTIYNDLDWNDYVYSLESLVNLSGKKLAKKKNLVSQFMRQYSDWEIKKIENKDFNEIMDFVYYWKSVHVEQNEYLDIEIEALKLALKNWDCLPNEGIKLYVEKKLAAFAIWSPQKEDMVTVHYEKYDPAIKGAGQVINHETAMLLKDRYKFANREQDMGLPGIRQAKRSYQPLRLVPFYRLKSK
ncbi:MAG: phosphatidylglycerol lysyltransferase domain-containing protein [Candidatus Cloacimonetes bacterium]|nr:phosphatidylglycerol lysyltransferase domain-containing protein [Candidatus Cloacimonadota bacterium]